MQTWFTGLKGSTSLRRLSRLRVLSSRSCESPTSHLTSSAPIRSQSQGSICVRHGYILLFCPWKSVWALSLFCRHSDQHLGPSSDLPVRVRCHMNPGLDLGRGPGVPSVTVVLCPAVGQGVHGASTVLSLHICSEMNYKIQPKSYTSRLQASSNQSVTVLSEK